MMVHDTKIGIVLKGDLLDWQKLNVAAFLSSGIAAAAPESIGQSYEDNSGNHYLPLFVQPVFVYGASDAGLQRTRSRAVSRGIMAAVYTQDMFATNNDQDNRRAVRAMKADDLRLVGLALRAESKTFDKIINGLKLHA